MADQTSPALKEIFNAERLAHIATEMTAVYPGFDAKAFLKLAKTGLAELSVMQRMARVSECLHAVLPLDYEESLDVLRALAPRLNSAFVSMFLPHYVATYGAHTFDLSMNALKYFTSFGSSEFAIRHFLRSDIERSLALMHDWSLDDNEHVRRLASEGSRPRLPWSFRLEQVQADPTLAAAILDNLKADDSLYVRKSVANHLNDITKDHPEWVLALIEGWSLDNKHTAWIARHALRSLIKQGNKRALAIIGAGGKRIARAASVWRARKESSWLRSAASSLASMATANSAALEAPALPMAKVATGMPLGICTMLCSESTPCRCLPATGTPSTGTGVLAASMPGRWAAPPAPAMIAFSPRPAASCA